MEKVIRFLMLNVVSKQLPHSEKIQTVMQEYFQGTENAALISNNLDSWRGVSLPFPLTIRSLDNKKAKNNHPFGALLLDLRGEEWQSKQIASLQRNANTRLVVLASAVNVEKVLEVIKAEGFCHVIIIIVHHDDIETLILKDPCNGINDEPERNTVIRNQCKANISFMDFPPNVLLAGGQLSGFEGLMMQTVAEHLGFKLSFVNRHETDWGQFDPPSGLQGDVATGASLAGLGALYPFDFRWRSADLLFGCNYITLAYAAPVSAGPTHPTWFVILVSELSSTVWICTLAMYLALIPISIALNWKPEQPIYWPFHVLGLLLGIPQQLHLRKALTLAIVLFGFVLTSYYQTMMSSKLTAPSPIPEITTLKELAESGLHFQGPPTAGDLVTAAADAAPVDVAKKTLSTQFEPVFADLDHILPRIVEQRDLAYLRHGANLYFHAQQNSRTAGRIHIVEEPILMFTPATIMHKHSCLSRKFQYCFHRLCDSGLSAKWVKDFTAVRGSEKQKGPRRLELEHIKGFLFLLVFGWGISCFTLFVELILYCTKAK